MMNDKDFEDFLKDIDSLTDSKIQENKDITLSDKLSENSKKPENKIVFREIDLHGYDVLGAQSKVVKYVSTFFELNQAIPVLHLRIITGKGRHSSGGKGKLVDEVYQFVRSYFKMRLLYIDEPPAELKINSLPIRGHFEIRVSR